MVTVHFVLTRMVCSFSSQLSSAGLDYLAGENHGTLVNSEDAKRNCYSKKTILIGLIGGSTTIPE